ncbi:MAG: ABC transporter substrate-binding protein [Promicromonosporaceae bacterium]|nr:ABC transporter substrate-binding protein [Promicromonosporaceae bacterium]
MKKTRGMAALALVVTGALALAGCSGGASGNGSSGGGNASGKVLAFGKPDGPQSNNSNPFLGSSAARTMGYAFAIYEPLVQPNTIDPTQKPEPWLASAYKWNDDYTQVTFTTRDNVKWSDGQPLTADDIAYSIQMRIDNKALNTENLPYKSVAVNGKDVVVTFDSSQFVNTNKVYGLFIVPKHIWSKIADPTTDLNQKPVGTGPYTLTSWTSQAVVLGANKDYWGGTPKVAKIQYQEFSDNTALTNALVAGDVQWGWGYIANYAKVFDAKDPKYVSWFPSGLGIDALWYNSTKGPFSDVNLRKAATMVIDRKQLSDNGSTGAAAPLTSVTGMPASGASFVAPKYQGQEYKVDLAGAKALLTQAGYTGVGTALKDKSGKPVSVTLTDPAGWNDYDAELQIIAASWKQLGIDAKIDNPTADQWGASLASGDFDAALHWTDGGSTPYDTYSDMLNGTYLNPPDGKAVYNFGQFDSKEATDALAAYASATTDAARTAALETVQGVLIDQAPVAPVLERPSWGQYSEKYFTGWPTKADPYADINMTLPAASLILTKLKPVS